MNKLETTFQFSTLTEETIENFAQDIRTNREKKIHKEYCDAILSQENCLYNIKNYLYKTTIDDMIEKLMIGMDI